MSEIEIIAYEDQYQEDFEKINRAWLEKYFEMEPEDILALKDPKGYFINQGGQVFIALNEDGIALGGLGLMHHSAKQLELSKMAVLEGYQNQGIGKKLLETAISYANDKGYENLYLETVSTLERAVALYEKYGFQARKSKSSSFKRVDLEMFKTL